MRLYLDTEFNGHGGELISMALVGKYDEWYCARQLLSPVDPWVADNVIPKLGTRQLSHESFRDIFHAWILEFENPEIICDWHADAEHFCKMLAGPDYTQSLDFPFRLTVLKTPPGQPVSANPHNALADARALQDWHERLKSAA